jgi:hypothetical protein
MITIITFRQRRGQNDVIVNIARIVIYYDLFILPLMASYIICAQARYEARGLNTNAPNPNLKFKRGTAKFLNSKIEATWRELNTIWRRVPVKIFGDSLRISNHWRGDVDSIRW